MKRLDVVNNNILVAGKRLANAFIYIVRLFYFDYKVRKVVRLFNIDRNKIKSCDINGEWVKKYSSISASNHLKLRDGFLVNCFSDVDRIIKYDVHTTHRHSCKFGELRSHFFDMENFPSFFVLEGIPKDTTSNMIVFPGQSDTPLYDVWFGTHTIGSAFAMNALSKGSRVLTPSMYGFGLASMSGGIMRENFLFRNSDKMSYLPTLIETKISLFELQIIQAFVLLHYFTSNDSKVSFDVVGHSSNCVTVAQIGKLLEKDFFHSISLYGGMFPIDQEIRFLDSNLNLVVDLSDLYSCIQEIGGKFFIGDKIK